MSGGELRDDALSGLRVIVAPGRADRPGAFAEHGPRPVRQTPEDCPFCAGHEDRTPPASLVLPADRAWGVRVVPNLYPSLGEPHGAQEVAIHGGRHVVALADLTEPELALVCEAWAQRAEAQRAAGWQHLFAFVNEGAGSGASLDHSHSQLAAFAEVPPGVVARAERCRQASCPVCHELASVEPERLVSDGAVAVWTPWASASAFQLRAAPRAHADDGFADPASLAAALGAISHAFARALGPIPWNAWLYSAPLAGEASFHWHLEAFPRVAAMAAFELGAGLPICQIAPESAAARMRQA